MRKNGQKGATHSDTSTKRPRGRPVDEAKRARILEAAREIFFERGVAGAHMDDIAEAAGATKVTLYKTYGDKQGLFDAVVEATSASLQHSLKDVALADAPVEEALTAFGQGLLTELTKDAFLKMDVLLTAADPQNRQAAKVFFERGPQALLETLAAYLEGRAKRGELTLTNPMRAAEELTSLWLGQYTLRRRFGQAEVMSDTDIQKRVADGLETFLKAYGPR